MTPCPMREPSPHEPRGRREGDRGRKAPLTPDQAALAADQALIAFFICFIGCFFFAKTIFSVLTCRSLGGRAG
jgi:hypothetical protein